MYGLSRINGLSDSFGSASDFARKYDIADGDDFSRAMQMVEKLYSERENLPSQFPYSPISRPVWDFTDTCHPKDTAIGCMITRIGLSMNTVRLFSLEGSLPKSQRQRFGACHCIPLRGRLGQLHRIQRQIIPTNRRAGNDCIWRTAERPGVHGV